MIRQQNSCKIKYSWRVGGTTKFLVVVYEAIRAFIDHKYFIRSKQLEFRPMNRFVAPATYALVLFL